jgi:hypothetical protein
MAIEAAMTASPAAPPACCHSASRPLQLYDPLAVTLAAVELVEAGALAACGPLLSPADATEVLGVVDVAGAALAGRV